MTTNADLTTWINTHVGALCPDCSPGRYILDGTLGKLFMYVDGTTAKWAKLTPGTSTVDTSGTMVDQDACNTILTANGL